MGRWAEGAREVHTKEKENGPSSRRKSLARLRHHAPYITHGFDIGWVFLSRYSKLGSNDR